MRQRFMSDWSAPTRRATAWCFSGPAVFWNQMSWAINPSPTAATKSNHFVKPKIHYLSLRCIDKKKPMYFCNFVYNEIS
uniref:Uncharacterized protein n=1 Tax=Lotus japonicus TaxID=34305 RepID=I3T0R5_LOTJA|nr:unknown [Lotus japonicus]